jgi:hypothetical protein
MPVELDSSLASVQTLTSSCSTMWRADAVVLSAKRHSTARILAIALKGRAGLRPASRSARGLRGLRGRARQAQLLCLRYI